MSELGVFVCMTTCGAFIRLLRRPFKKMLSSNRISAFFADVMLTFLGGLPAVMTVFAFNDGKLDYFVFIALLLGLTLPSLIIKNDTAEF